MSEETVSALKRFRTWFASMSKLKKTAVLLALFMLLSIGTAGATAYWYYNRISDIDRMFPDLTWDMDAYDSEEFPDIDDVFQARVLNILLMGFDRNATREETQVVFRPDTLMVAAVNLDTGKVDLVSIPRDTLVPLPGNLGRQRINTVYYYGSSSRHTGLTDPDEQHKSGLEATAQSVSQILHGIPINYYVAVDMDVVVEIVDIMGGVWYDVPQDIYGRDGKLLLNSGYQRLTGSQFLRFVRNRRFRMGDLQRVENQQSILVAAFEQFQQTGKLMSIPQLYLSVRANVSTNLSLDQIAALTMFAAQNVSSENIYTHTVAGRSAYGRLSENQTRSRSFYLLDQQKRAALVKDIWGLVVNPGSPDTLYPPLADEPDWDGESYHDSYQDEHDENDSEEFDD